MRTGIEIEVAADDRARLEAIVADRNRRRKHVERARIVLLSANGACARCSGSGGRTVSSPTASGPSSCPKTRSSPPSSRTFVGLYVDPPAHSLVLSVDEKSQIQALDRTQPGLPIKKGKAGTMTFDYRRNGTTTLFAALDVLEGTVIGQCMQRHRHHQEFIRFLNAIERAVPAGKVIHVILDNYATHKHPKVLRWLSRRPRFVFHFTPTSCSWLNAVETVLSALSRRRLKRGVFRSIIHLQPPSTATSWTTMLSPNPLSGPLIPTSSSARSRAGLKR
jgi:hypothetical protein